MQSQTRHMSDAQRILAPYVRWDGECDCAECRRDTANALEALIKNATPAMIAAGTEWYERVHTGGGVTRQDAIEAAFVAMLRAETREEQP